MKIASNIATLLFSLFVFSDQALSQDRSAGRSAVEAAESTRNTDEPRQSNPEVPPEPRPRSRQRMDARNLRNAPALRQLFGQLVTDTRESIVEIYADGKRVCLGTVVSGEGHIVTKASLAKGELHCRVDKSAERIPVKRLATNPDYDLAILRAEGGDWKPVDWELTSQPSRGSFVVSPTAGGKPHAVGVVSVEKRRFSTRQPSPEKPRGYLGVMVDARKESGVLLRRVLPGSGAAKAGLKINDVVLQAAGRDINAPEELVAALSQRKPGDEVALKIQRGDEALELTVKLGALPGGARLPLDRWGGGPFSQRRFGFPEVLAHDSVVAPNFVGGPLLDTQGRAIGLNIARALRVTTYAVAAADVHRIVQGLLNPDTGASGAAIATTDIRASGIDGSVIVCGRGPAPDDALKSFLQLSGKGDARVVVLQCGQGNGDDGLRIHQRWKEEKGQSLRVFSVAKSTQGTQPPVVDMLADATGVWIDATDAESLQGLSEDDGVVTALRGVLQRGGVVGGTAPFAELAGSYATGDEVALWKLLPQCLVVTEAGEDDAGMRDTLAAQRTVLGITLAPETALVLRGRYLYTAGDGVVSIAFGPSREYPEKTVELSGRSRQADLTALRRFAVQRTQPLFPAAMPAPPVVPQGTLMIVGGGGMPRDSIQRFVKEAGGAEAKIVVIPISMPDPLPKQDRMQEALQKAGAQKVTVLRGRTPADVDSKESLQALREATGIWFGGGRQWRFIDAYEGTQAAQLMHQVLKRGGIIAGSSAGASIQGEYMARGNPLGSREIMAEGYERGLGFLPGVAIDQHFSQRKRFADLASLVNRYPQLLGIGIDEATALIVKGQVAEVIGKTRVCFYDNTTDSAEFTSVPAGQRYDLVTRQTLVEDDE